MRKKILISVLVLFLLIIAGALFSDHDNTKYKNVLNRNGVSEEAVIIKSSSDDSIVSSLKYLVKHTDLDFRLHFVNKKNYNTSYLYNQNEKIKIPISKGRIFSSNDFKAATPFVIVGKNVTDTYKPQEQTYLKVNNRYLPVIGQTGVGENSKLNDHIFISISPNFFDNNERISDYKIILDGIPQKKKRETINIVKKAFHSKNIINSRNQINNVKQKLIEKDNYLLILLVIITIVITILSFNLLVPMKYSINNSNLDGDLQTDFEIGLIIQYILYNIFSFGLSYIIIVNSMTIINKSQFLIFYMINISIIIALGFYVIFKKSRRLRS